MIDVASANINSFGNIPKADFEQPSEQLITLTAGQLQDLLGAIHSLKAEVAALQEQRHQDHQEIAELRQMVASLEATQDTQGENQFIMLKLINGLKEERAPPEPTKKTQDHINDIALILGTKEKRLIEDQASRHYLQRYREEGMTFSQLAGVMGLTVDRIRQLSRIAATDQRFNICWHPRKKNTKIFKLRRWDAPGL